MKALEVHKLLRRRFVPLVREHGFDPSPQFPVGTFRRVIGDASLTLGYSLGVGCWRGIGGDLEMTAAVLQEGRYVRSLRSTGAILSGAIRARYRDAAVSLQRRVLGQVSLDEPASAMLDAYRDRLQGELDRAELDPGFVPSYRYQTPEDVLAWCRLVAPGIAAAIERLEQASRRSEPT